MQRSLAEVESLGAILLFIGASDDLARVRFEEPWLEP
jgi:hypothetical protein